MENEMMNPMDEDLVLNEDVILEEEILDTPDDEEVPAREPSKLARKCAEAKSACKGTVARIARDLKESDYNPYIKQTQTTRLEIYRNCNETEPIDVYETTDSKQYSARSMAIATAVTAAVVLTAKCIAKKLLK